MRLRWSGVERVRTEHCFLCPPCGRGKGEESRMQPPRLKSSRATEHEDSVFFLFKFFFLSFFFVLALYMCLEKKSFRDSTGEKEEKLIGNRNWPTPYHYFSPLYLLCPPLLSSLLLSSLLN